MKRHIVEYLFVSILIIGFTFLNSLQYWNGYIHTPKDHIFLGTMHNPGDYFYYLSQFKQGQDRWINGYNFMTGEFKDTVYIGWINILSGKLFSIIGIHAIFAYQITVLIGVGLVLSLSYLFIQLVFPKADQRNIRLITFFLFLISNAFPKVIQTIQGTEWSYASFWFDSGIPFIRLGGVPHHLLASSIMLGIFLLFNMYSTSGAKLRPYHKLLYIGVFFIFGSILSSLNPVVWAVTLGISGCSLGIFSYKKHSTTNISAYISHVSTDLLPLFFFFLGGIPVILYFDSLFRSLPYVQLKQWEATHQLHISIQEFLSGYGPIGIIGLLGFPFLLYSKKQSLPVIISGLLPIMCVLLFFSSIPNKFDLHNIRFLPQLILLFLSITVVYILDIIGKKIPKWIGLVQGLFVVLILCITIPSWIIQIKELTSIQAPNDLSFYIHKNQFAFFEHMESLSTTNDTFLVPWPYNLIFPAISGRRVFHAHDLLTIDYNTKDAEAFAFFGGGMNPNQMKEFLSKRSINYVIAYPWQLFITNLPYLQKTYEDAGLTVYKYIP